MKCPKCRSNSIDANVVTREPYDIVTCSGSRSIAFKTLRKYRCHKCNFKWEKN